MCAPRLAVSVRAAFPALQSAPVFTGYRFPAPQRGFPALQFLQGIAFQRPRGALQRSKFSRWLSCAPLFPGAPPQRYRGFVSSGIHAYKTKVDAFRCKSVVFRRTHNRQDELEIDWPVSFQLCLVACTVPAGAAVDATLQPHLRKTRDYNAIRKGLDKPPPAPPRTYLYF